MRVLHFPDITQIISFIKLSTNNILGHSCQENTILPRCHHEEVHEVPGVPHVASLVEHEAEGEDLGAHLRGEDHHEDNLQLLLKERRCYEYFHVYCVGKIYWNLNINMKTELLL